MSQKRIRSSNWDKDEKQLFRWVLKEYAHMIEDKSLCTNAINAKNKAWGDVHKKFNQINKRPRSLNQLKTQWKGMKVNARKMHSSFEIQINESGAEEEHMQKFESAEEEDLQTIEMAEEGVIPKIEIAEEEEDTQKRHSSFEKQTSETGGGARPKIFKDDEQMRKIEMAEEEHIRKMEMAEEEHLMKMEIHREKLKAAILEREILELKKEAVENNKSFF